MFVKLPRMIMMACLLCPSLSWALGLGEIHLHSALNEPLNAEIDLIAATPDELIALRATIADRDAFTRYGIDRPPFLSSLTFKVGKGKDGRDALLVQSTDAIPEPFVTFLVEVNWARGRLMREYTVLLDPPVYTPGESPSTSAPVTAASSAPTQATGAPAQATGAPAQSHRYSAPPVAAAPGPASRASAASSANGASYRVGQGDTLTKIARSLRAETPANIDQTMIALYRANPDAFGGNINILRRGAVLRVPGGDEIAALNQNEAISEVRRQMSSWREAGGAAPVGGHLRLVTPGNGSGAGTNASNAPASSAGPGKASNATAGETQALQDRVRDLESQLAESRRLIDVRNAELSELQRKLGAPAAAAAKPPAPPSVAQQPAATPAPAPTPAPPPAAQPPEQAASAPTPAPTPSPVKNKPEVTPAPAASGSWIDWVASNWWLPAAIIIALLAGLAIAARRRRSHDPFGDLGRMEATDVAEARDPTSKLKALRRGDDSFVVEETGAHRMPDVAIAPDRHGDTATDVKATDDTISSESAVNLDQGDPLAEADFHMAYGLYDQAADLVRIALEREPDRRDLRMKLLEIYFVWGNKDAFLQTAKSLEATRDRAPGGEWDKIVIMGKQICPDEPLFTSSAGGGRGAGALVDLNLEGGENRVDIDLFGDPEGERSSLDRPIAKEGGDTAATGESPGLHSGSDLDFMLDSPERGADESPTREMPPRDEPTVESELMNFSSDTPTAESPTLGSAEAGDRIASKLAADKPDQTAEVSIDDLGLDLDGLEQTGSPSGELPQLAETDHPSDAPTMLAGMDERSRKMMAEAESRSRDRDMTELERELEASFIADLDSAHDDVKTAVLGPESAPTVNMPRDVDVSATSNFKSPEFSDADHVDVDSTSKLRGISSDSISADSIDLDLDRLATALGSGDTVQQPRAAEEVFSTEVFEASQRSKRVDLDVGDALNGEEHSTTRQRSQARTDKLKAVDPAVPELEPVTMSEVGTKLDLARAYMDMGDPEGARSILEEVVQEGSASQKQEAQRLIESLPG